MIGRLIREYRRKCGMKQSDLAAAIGVKRYTIIRWEAGSFEPRVSQFFRAARVLHIPDNMLVMRGEEDERTTDTTTD